MVSASTPRRSTRSSTTTASSVKKEEPLTPPRTPSPTKQKGAASSASKRKRTSPSTPAAGNSRKNGKANGAVKKEEEEEAEEEEDEKPDVKPKKAKQNTTDKKLASLRASLAEGPFPNHARPTPEEAQQVAEILTEAHGYKTMPFKQPPRGDDRFGGCGDVASVLDATVRTILSCNTSGKNSRNAHKSLCETFGKNNWQAVLDAPHEDLAKSIQCGGLHVNKARTIQGVLRQTLERHGKLSLDHLHTASSSEVMEELVSFNGVGPKVASCVSAFCIGNDEMAVDTHVHRLCRKLGWVPDKATRDQTYYHLYDRIPPKLKYPLHVLLIKHGKACAECSARGFATDRYSSPDWEKEGMSVISGVKQEEWKEDDKEKFAEVKCPLRQAGLFSKCRAAGVKKESVKQEKATPVKQEEAGSPVKKEGRSRVKKEEETT